MGKYPVLKPAELIKVLKKIGFIEVRQRGSHIQFRHPDGRGTTVPNHKGKDISPILLKLILNISFHISFDDGFEADVTAKMLREHCPCAECSGEEVLLYKFTPQNKKPLTDASFELEKAEMVGNYAIQLFWKDGHNTGLYNWLFLRELANVTVNHKS